MRFLFKTALSSSLMLFTVIGFTSAQENNNDCRVLKKEISESYQGECKDGLAHGNGIAQGIDTYEGKFKKGLPDGSGKYTWANGNYFDGRWKEGKKSGKGILYTKATDHNLKGMWKDDAFIKEIKDPPYDIILKTGITGINFYKDNEDEPYNVELVFQKDGSQTRSVGQLQLVASSGRTKTSSGFSGFESVQFPFEGSVEFVEASRMGTIDIRYQVKFKIIEEGSWRIIIRY